MTQKVLAQIRELDAAALLLKQPHHLRKNIRTNGQTGSNSQMEGFFMVFHGLFHKLSLGPASAWQYDHGHLQSG